MTTASRAQDPAESAVAGEPDAELTTHQAAHARMDQLLAKHYAPNSDQVSESPAGSLDYAYSIADQLASRSKAEATRYSYRGHLLDWQRWCRAHDICPLPAHPRDVAAHLGSYGLKQSEQDGAGTGEPDGVEELVAARAMVTIEVRRSAIDNLHTHAGHPLPGRDRFLRDVVKGLRHTIGSRAKHRRAAIDKRALETLVGHVRQPDRREVRDRALRLLQKHLLASPGQLSRLNWADLSDDGDAVLVTLTPDHRFGRPVTIRLSSAGRLDACPVRALRLWRAQCGGEKANGFVFSNSCGRGLTRAGITKILAAGERAQCAGAGALAPTLPQAAEDGAATQRCRNVALLCMGFYGALRRSEGSQMLWGHLSRDSDGDWSVLIPFSKTDQEGQGQHIVLPRAPQDDPTCPARALDAWRAHVHRVLGHDPLHARRAEPVLPRLTPTGSLNLDSRGRLQQLSGDGINSLIAGLAVDARLPGAGARGDGEASRNPYGGHSLRAGFVTEALRRNVSLPDIALQTRHKSFQVLLGYGREHDLKARNPGRRLFAQESAPAPAPSPTRRTRSVGLY